MKCKRCGYEGEKIDFRCNGHYYMNICLNCTRKDNRKSYLKNKDKYKKRTLFHKGDVQLSEMFWGNGEDGIFC